MHETKVRNKFYYDPDQVVMAIFSVCYSRLGGLNVFTRAASQGSFSFLGNKKSRPPINTFRGIVLHHLDVGYQRVYDRS